MKAIVVAGGKGERLRPITETIPKPMVPVNGTPILEHTINLLKKHGVTEFIIALCYLPEVITEYFGDGSKFGITITYTYEDPLSPLGTAGAILLAKEQIQETFIVTYADILRSLDVTKQINQHRISNSIATINGYRNTSKTYKSSLIFDETNNLIQFNEMSSSTPRNEDEVIWSNGSFYIFEPEIFDYIKKGVVIDFAKNIFPEIISEGKKISVFPTSGYFIDIGTKEKLEKANKDLLDNPMLLN